MCSAFWVHPPTPVPYPAHLPALLHSYLGLLQPPVEAPEVLGEELAADGLPIDADPLTHLHQVGRAARRPKVIRTPCPRPLGLPPPTSQNCLLLTQI